MRILVCIKQVPGTAKVDIDEKTGVLKRSGVDSKMNPYDLYAIETALRLKELTGASVCALSMGPSQAADVLREALMMGVDECALLSDRAFAGADVLATSRALSGAVQVLGGFDLIICGKQTTDGDTAQVGPEMAEHLGISHASNVSEIISCSESSLRVDVNMGESSEIQEISMPCLITAEKDIFVPRLPSYKRKLKTAGADIRLISLNDLPDSDPKGYGLSGSPTQVERIFPPESNSGQVMLRGDPEELAERIFNILNVSKFI
ncbi:MAG: electron transfer flavoprotein subunit beta/FixA family protein [Clostridiales bacterium]|nr:electron transfer flavoprotein subunit beta/FixA family protein [Clostridiales bacterium]